MSESHDVTISYNNVTIATMDASGIEVLETNGTICSDDITIEYTKSGGSANLQAKTNINPTTSSQTITPDSGYDGLSSVQINAISPTKSAQTYTPTTSNQTIASGRWLLGTQTILGDANLVAGNIKKDVSIFGVTGTYEGSGGGGGATVQFSWSGVAVSRAIYIDENGVEHNEEPAAGSWGNGSTIENNVVVFFAQMPEPGSVPSLTGLSEIATINLGTRAKYKYAYVYRAVAS